MISVVKTLIICITVVAAMWIVSTSGKGDNNAKK